MADYRLCVYSASGFLLGASGPAGDTNWSALSDKGCHYKDTAGSEAGINKVTLKVSDPGEDKARFIGTPQRIHWQALCSWHNRSISPSIEERRSEVLGTGPSQMSVAAQLRVDFGP